MIIKNRVVGGVNGKYTHTHTLKEGSSVQSDSRVREVVQGPLASVPLWLSNKEINIFLPNYMFYFFQVTTVRT